MNQALLHAPLQLPSDNSLPSEQDYIENIGSHAHQSSFASGVSEHLRRDGILGTGLPLSSSRYGAPRSETAYQTGAAFSDSGSGSISTSPSSNASSAAAYSSYATYTPSYPSHYPAANNYSIGFGCGVSGIPTRRLTDPSSSAMLPPNRSPGLMSSVPPSMGMSARDNYTTTTPGLHRHPHTTLSPRYSDTHRYHSQPETPRSLLPPAMPPTNYATAYQSAYTPHSGANESPPFNAQETYHTIMCEGVSIVPTIEAKIEKGFFLSGDDVWTCYRRNYFAVNVSYTLNPWTNANNSRLYLDQGNGKPQEPIQSMAVSLAAAVDGSAGKTIELIQHTPKRDKGPQLEMKKELLAPTPPGKNHDHSTYGYHQSSSASGPLLPLQSIEGDSSQSYSPTSHTNNNHQHPFERIQFKSATANNGKRRAQQQYYHLIVELWANIQNTRDHEPRWVKVAAKLSHPVVVRGRSPSHYQNEGPHNATARGPGNSGFGGSGQNGLSSHGRTSYSAFGNGLSGGGATGMGGGMYRGGTTYSLDPSPVGSHSVSSASSMSGGPSEGLVGDQHMVDEDDPKILGGQHPYQYFPSALYEDLPPKVDGVLPPLERRVVKEEYQRPSALATGWQVGGCGRYTGMESSHGYYPEVHASSGY